MTQKRLRSLCWMIENKSSNLGLKQMQMIKGQGMFSQVKKQYIKKESYIKMSIQAFSSPIQDQLIKFLFEDMNICNWGKIAAQVSKQVGSTRTPEQCKNKFLAYTNYETPKNWSISEERELYKLHDQHGNKWTIIASQLLGRSDNCVKNHLYSKLRKSLRTLNKIIRVCFKRQLKEISMGVLYKLTQATEQKFKQDPGVEEELLEASQRLKNGLLQYEIDDQDINKANDYGREKQFIKQLLTFNKEYKKKSKKQKTQSGVNSQNIRKALQKKKQQNQKITNQKMEESLPIPKSQLLNPCLDIFQGNSQISERKTKKLANLIIKAPTIQQASKVIHPPQKKMSGIEDILKAQGILENGDYEEENIFKRQPSLRSIRSNRLSSFSNVEQSSQQDMFGEDLGFSQMKELSQMDGDSQIFQNQQSHQ